MGVMEKMRDGTKYILWVLIIAFGLLWGLQDTRVFDAIMAGPQSLGEVNGDPITLEEYNQRTQYYIERYTNQTGGTVTPEMRAYYEDQAWQELVNSKLLQQKMEELGITVTDAELVEMITGPNPDPFIRQQFQKEDGTLDRVALQAAIESPENTQIWIMIEQQLRQQRRQQKLNNYVESGLVVGEEDVKSQYIADNTTANVAFVRFPYAQVEESELNITDSDLESYYNENLDEYNRKESYRFEYVSFSKEPTSKDTSRTIEEVANIREEFANAENDSLFMAQYASSTPYNGSYVNTDDVKESFQRVLELSEGEVSELFVENGRVHLLKLIDQRRDEVKFANFSYEIVADPIATVDAQAEQADDFSFFAEEDGFNEEADRRELTVKSGFATKDQPFIVGLGQSRQIMDFLTAKAEEGVISEPIELDDKFVVLQVTEVIPEGPRPFSDVRNQIEQTVKNEKRKTIMLERVKQLRASNSDLASLAEAGGIEVQTAETVRMSATVLVGAGREPMIIGSMFGAPLETLSDALAGTNGVFVYRVNSLNEADPANLTGPEKQQIRRQLAQAKTQSYLQVWLEQLKEDADINDYRSMLLQS